MNPLIKENSRLHIVDDYATMTCKIYLVEIRGMQEFLIGYDGEHLVSQVIGEVEPISKNYIPLLQIPLLMKSTLLYHFANAAKENNIRREDDSVTEGKLIATNKHLEDMRQITSKLLKMELK